jgi:hypothetical protein
MVADIAPQQQLPEVFSTNRNHHCSHKRNSNSNTMTNGQRYVVRNRHLHKSNDFIRHLGG